MHSEAQGEFGVTCKLVTCCVRNVRIRRDRREAISPGDMWIIIVLRVVVKMNDYVENVEGITRCL